MGKQTDATIYYCDKCHKSIISSPAIAKDAECLATAHGMIKDEDLPIQDFPFSASVMNKLIKPTIESSARDGEVQQEGIMATLELKIVPETVYYCSECAEKILQDYIDKCNEINQLFE